METPVVVSQTALTIELIISTILWAAASNFPQMQAASRGAVLSVACAPRVAGSGTAGDPAREASPTESVKERTQCGFQLLFPNRRRPRHFSSNAGK